MNEKSHQSPSSSERGWKKHLLSSGVPLEHEVGRYLTAQGLSWDADFPFTRNNNGNPSEGSVDMACFSYESFGNTELAYKLSLLIECKYRSANKKLVLLPHTNDHSGTLGYTLNYTDDLSRYYLRSESTSEYERSFPFVYKGVEVYDGGAIEREFRHGIEQLRYAAPVLARKEIDFQLGAHMDDVVPIFTSKILVTNAPMRIIKPDIYLSDIESAHAIEEISDSVETCILYSEQGPDYGDYVRSVFSVDTANRESNASFHAEQLEMAGKHLSKFSDPYRLVRELSRADPRRCTALGSQFFVTSLAGLPDLISGIRRTCRATYRYKTKTDTFTKELRKKIRP